MIISIIIIAILVVTILVLLYQIFSYKSKYELIKKSLGKESATLEGSLIKIKELEAQRSLSQQEIEDNKKVLEDQREKVKKLMDDLKASNVTLEQKTKDLANARKTIYEVDDYILENHFGSDKESILRIRRLRDVILLNLNHFRKTTCKLYMNSNNIMEILKYLRTSPPYSTAVTLEGKKAVIDHAEKVWKEYDRKLNEYRYEKSSRDQAIEFQEINAKNKLEAEKQGKPFVPLQITQFDKPLPENPQKTLEIDAAEKILLWNWICKQKAGDPKNLKSDIKKHAVGQWRQLPKNQNWPKDWPVDAYIALMDEIENVFMSVYDKACIDNFPNYLVFGDILENLVNSLCQPNDATINGMLNKPLDMTLAKSSALFL